MGVPAFKLLEVCLTALPPGSAPGFACSRRIRISHFCEILRCKYLVLLAQCVEPIAYLEIKEFKQRVDRDYNVFHQCS